MAALRKKERSDSILSKEYLCKAMELLLNEREYTAITVTDICKRAGVSRITFYKYFSSKEALSRAMTQHNLHTAWEGAEHLDNRKKRVERLLSALVPLGNAIKNLIRNGQTLLMYGCFRDFFRRVLNKGDEQGDLRASGYAGGIFMIATEWIMGGMNRSTAEMAEILDRDFLSPLPI